MQADGKGVIPLETRRLEPIDAARLRLDAQIVRLDLRIDRLSMQVDALTALLDEHLQRHAG